jgi:dTDP-4-dehydrorhamnose 3,5-epimerase
MMMPFGRPRATLSKPALLWYIVRPMSIPNVPEASVSVPDPVTPVKDEPSITADGQSLKPLIVGVKVRYQRAIEDPRGEITEVYRPSWGVNDAPLVYVYQASIRPGVTKGWLVHQRQEDRLFHIMGTTHWALYDDRPDSSTRGLLNQFVFSEKNRGLLVIPRGVYHAVRNIGVSDAIYMNMPTRPYDHGDPDKYRLPVKNSLIPFSFGDPSR